jgi:hypothetical protein
LLIVAIPKSASSSLVASVQEATGWAKSNAGIRKQHLTPLPAPEGYGQLKRFHSEVAELTPDVVELLKQPDQIVKLHIAPTANNLALLRDVPKVVLLRPAKEIVAAYWRGQETSTWTTTVGEIARCKSPEQWQQEASRLGLTGELNAFNDDWRSGAGNALVITYAELTGNPEQTIGKVMKYFGIEADNVPSLGQVNYTRDGGANTPAWKKAWFFLKRQWARLTG